MGMSSLLESRCEGLIKMKGPAWFGTFTWLAFIHLMRAAAFVLQDLNDHSSGTSVAAGGFEAPPLQAGQLAGAPRRPDS